MSDPQKMILYRKRQDLLFQVLGLACMLLGILVLVILLARLFHDGWPRLTSSFFSNFPSRRAENAGILSAWVGSLLLMLVTMLTAVPIGIAAAVYLEEYAKRNWFTTLIEINISNLAGVPSIIYGLMALGMLSLLQGSEAFLSSTLHWKIHLNPGRSILLGGMTLGLLVLPIIIVATREALRTIPQAIREAAYACGATKWQVIRYHLLPYSMGGIATGTIIAMSRAVGETAPLITIGALTYVAFLPKAPIHFSPFELHLTEWLTSGFTALPIQMFNWTSRPQASFHQNAAAAGLVLIAFTLTMNAIAIWVRYRVRSKIKW